MMKTILLALALTAASTPAATPANLAGPWKFDLQRDNHDQYRNQPEPSVCRLKQDGRKLTGDCGSDKAGLMGEVNGRHVTVRVEAGTRTTLTGEVNADGTTISGTWHELSSFGRFTATRQ